MTLLLRPRRTSERPRGRFWVKRILWTVPKGQKHTPDWWADYIIENWERGAR